MAEPAEITFSPTDTNAEIAEKLTRLTKMMRERVQFGEVRVGDITKLHHNGDITCADVECEDVDAEDVDVEGFTMATGAAAGSALVSDAEGVGTWLTATSITAAGSDTEVQYNNAGVFGAEAAFTYDPATNILKVDHIDLDGTETDELLDVDRAIDTTVTKDAVTVTEARSGIVGLDLHAGFRYTSTVNVTFADAHYGFYSKIDHDAGTLLSSYPFYAVIDAEAACGNSQLYSGSLAYDAVPSGAVPTLRAGLGLTVKGKSANDVFGAYTSADNDHTGDAVGYKGFGNNSGTVADAGAGDAYGLVGFAASAEKLAVGVQGLTQTKDADSFAFVGEGHNHFSDGVTYIYISDPAATVGNKTHINETDDGSLWVENKLEVDAGAYFDSTIDVDGQADFNDDVVIDGELKGSRCCFTAGRTGTTASTAYLNFHGITMDANHGHVMPRAGSIVTVSGMIHVVNSTGGLAKVDILINNSLAASTDNVIGDDHVGDHVAIASDPVARGAVTFSAEDVIQFKITHTGTIVTSHTSGVCDVQFDT